MTVKFASDSIHSLLPVARSQYAWRDEQAFREIQALVLAYQNLFSDMLGIEITHIFYHKQRLHRDSPNDCWSCSVGKASSPPSPKRRAAAGRLEPSCP